MSNGRVLAVVVASFAAAIAGCGVTENSDGVRVRVKPLGGSTQTFSISGTVLSGISSARALSKQSPRGGTKASRRGPGKSSQAAPEMLAADPCASATCSTIVVGGGGTKGPSCTVSNGTFTIDSVPAGQQLVAKFGCGGTDQSCIVMSGDNGVTCDPVSDGVMQAFLKAMGSTSLSEEKYASANIAQIAHSIEQATKNSTTAAMAFEHAVAACATDPDPKSCNLAAIKSSPFAGPFTLMKKMVSGWDAEAVYTFVTDVLGYQVEVDTLTYTDFGTRLDSWLGVNFIAQTRALINSILTDQNAGGSNYVVKMACKMEYSKYMGHGLITYSPRFETVNNNGQNIQVPTCKDVNDGTGPLSLNGYTAPQITTINAAVGVKSGEMVNLSPDPPNHPCNTPMNNDPLYFCVNAPRMVIMSKAEEPDRNDPLGTNNNNFIHVNPLSMIEVFPPVMRALQNPNPPDPNAGPGGSACLSFDGSGGPIVVNDGNSGPCNTWFKNLMVPHKHEFSGVMGIYLALANNTLGSSAKLSLKEIYKIFSNDSFLSARLTQRGNDMSNFMVNSLLYTVGGTHTYNIYPILNDTGGGVCTLDTIFMQGSPQTVSVAAAHGYYAATAITYADSLKMFERIPTASAIHDFVFKSAYHVNFNPTGGSTYGAMGKSSGGPNPQTDPIFCKMKDKTTQKLIEVDMATQKNNVEISCIASTDPSLNGSVTVDANGNITVPVNFDYPYTLTQFGYQGDSKGGIFALADWKTGVMIAPNGNKQFVYQKNTNNPVCNDVDNKVGEVVQAKMIMGNGSNNFEQLITAYCMDMSSFAISPNEQFYYAGMVEIPMGNQDCPSCSWRAQAVGGLKDDGTSYSTPEVCAWTAGFTTDANTGITSTLGPSGVVIDWNGTAGTGHVTSMGDIIIDHCSADPAPAGTKYKLISMGFYPGKTLPGQIYAQLLPITQGAKPLQFKAMPTDTWVSPDTVMIGIDGGMLNAAFAERHKSETGNVANTNVFRVAPLGAPANLMYVQLANRNWETKFDPYCDASNEPDGKCHCTDGTTGLEKSGDDCTLEDTPRDSTISQPPFWAKGNPAGIMTFFSTMGGKSGAELKCGNAGLPGCNNNNAGLSWDNQPAILKANGDVNWNMALRCKYLVLNEETYRHPSGLNNDWTQDQQGCPANSSTASAAVTNGPVALIKPAPMNNAYAVLMPNLAVKLANFITRDIGQGVAIDPDAKLFTFDTAVALIAFRMQFPRTGITATSGGKQIPGSFGVYQPIADPTVVDATGSENNKDPLSQVLCYLGHSAQPCL